MFLTVHYYGMFARNVRRSYNRRCVRENEN